MKIRKPNTLNSDQKRTPDSIWKLSRGLTLSTCLLTFRQIEPVCTISDSRENPVDSHVGLVDRVLSTAEMACRQTKQTVAPVGVFTYLLHHSTSCKLCTNTKELKNSTIKILHSLPTRVYA